MSFTETLIDAALSQPLEEIAFFKSLKRGDYPRSALRIYIQRVVRISEIFPNNIARIVALCPDPQFRLHLIENLMEEEGIVVSPTTGLLERFPEKNHFERGKLFGYSLGISDEEFANPAWQGNSKWVEEKLKAGHWHAAAAFLLIGAEANVPRIFRQLVSAFKKHYGYKDTDLSYFIDHLELDEIHGKEAANLLANAVPDQKDRELVLEAVKRGAAAQWLFYQKCDRDMRRQMATSPSL